MVVVDLVRDKDDEVEDATERLVVVLIESAKVVRPLTRRTPFPWLQQFFAATPIPQQNVPFPHAVTRSSLLTMLWL